MIRSAFLALALLLLGGAGAQVEAKPLPPIDWKAEERLERMKDATRDAPLAVGAVRKPTKLIREVSVASETCKGSRGRKADAACARSLTLYRRINEKGWCYGKSTDDSAMDRRWHHCGPDSLLLGD